MHRPHKFKLRIGLISLRLLCGAAVLFAVQFGFQQAAPGQGVGENFSDVAPGGQTSSFFDSSRNISFWANYTAGRGMGDVMGNTKIGGNGYRFMPNGVCMFTGQFLITEFGDPSLSLGFQRRVWINDNTAVGGGFYYDAMESYHSNTFQQTSFNFELFRDDWTIRTNGYLPVGPKTRNIITQNGMVSSQPVFQGNQIGTQLINFAIDETAMRGIDIEIARSVGNSGSEVFVGYHNFQGYIGTGTDGIHGGWRGNLAPDLAANVAISDDPAFGTNVYGGFTWFFGGTGGNGVAPRTIEEKMTIPVIREQQVVLNEVQTQNFNFFQPLTSRGQIITFNHINSGAVNGNGTIENPYGTLTDADQDPNKNNRNIVYVHSGSTFNSEGYGLAQNQRFVGEGDNNNHFVQTDQLGPIVLPQVNGNQFPRPVINGANVGLLANNNTQISNVRIENANRAIQAPNIAGNVNVNRTLITGGDVGIDIIGGSGTFTFGNVEIDTTSAAAIRANNMLGRMNVNQSRIDGALIGIDIIGGTGVFDFNDVDFNNNDTGIRGVNHGGDVAFNRSLITGGDAGIDIIGGTGTFTFTDVDIDGQADAGIIVAGGDSGITFDSLSSINQGTGGTAVRVIGGHNGRLVFDTGSTIDATMGDGLRFDNANGEYDFRGQVQLNGGNAGIDILGGSAGTFTFTDTTITNPTGDALNVIGGNSTIIFEGLSSINQNNPGSSVRVRGGHDGTITFNPGTSITSTGGNGLQFDDADGQYDFRGQVQLNGGDAGIDILGDSAGTFTFTDTTITNPTGEGINIDGGSSNVTFDGFSRINKNNTGSAVRVHGGHNGNLTFNPGTGITAMDGDGLQFDNADGTYDFRGQVQLNGGDAGIDILGDSAGTFTFTNTDITNPTGTGINIDGAGSSTVTFDGLSSINKNNTGSTVRVAGGHNGSLTFNPGTGITANDGDGLQFDNADGIYDFRGDVQLNGGDAGIDILGGSAGTFTFTDTTTITNPTGAAFNVQDLETGGSVNYDGSIESNNDVIIAIDTTAPGTSINFISNGANSLTSTDNPNGAMFIFDADGDITITTPMTVIRPTFSSLFATDGDGTWTFNDMTITDQVGLNGGIDVFGNQGVVNFTNLNITTDSAGTGDATTGFLAGGNNEINVFGNSNINADGGGALVLININTINMTWQNVTSTNNLNSQIGFAGDDGIDLLNVVAGTLDITGLTEVRDADGVAISIEDTGATVTFQDILLDGIGLDGIISGVAFDSAGIVNINGGTVNNTGQDGARIGSSFGSGVLGGFNLNNVTFTNIGGSTVEAANSVLSGSGNIDTAFSCTDFGGNIGKIFFNGGADSCPN